MLEDSRKIARLLVVSRDTSLLEAVWSLAGPNHWQAEAAGDILDALEKIYSQVPFDLLILDLSSDPANGAQVSKILSRISPQLPVVVIGRTEDLDRRQEVARMAASEHLERPIQTRELESAIRRNLSASIDFVETESAGEPPAASANGQQKPVKLSQSPLDARGHKSLRSLLRSVKEEAERSAIARALEETGWNRKAAARLLKTSYRTVLYKIEQYQMTASNSAVLSNGRNPRSAGIESNVCGDKKVEVGSQNHGA